MGEVISGDNILSIVLDALFSTYDIIKLQAVLDPGVSLDKIEQMMPIIYTTHLENIAVDFSPQKSRQPKTNSRGFTASILLPQVLWLQRVV